MRAPAFAGPAHARKTRILGRGCAFALLLGLSLPLGGCQAPAQPSGPTAALVRLSDRERFLDRTLTVLREHDLQPQRVDWDAGLAVTQPTTSGQWFEFWRSDAPGAYQTLESSLHTTQRVVTIQVLPAPPGEPAARLASLPGPEIAPTTRSGLATSQAALSDTQPASAPAAGEFVVTVQVDKYRYSTPERQVTAPSAALGLYSERLPTESGERVSRALSQHWIPVGRDGLLERQLLDRIVRAEPGATFQRYIEPSGEP